MTTVLAVEVPRPGRVPSRSAESAHPVACFPTAGVSLPSPCLCWGAGLSLLSLLLPLPRSLTPCHGVPVAAAAPAPSSPPRTGSGPPLPGVPSSFLPWRLLPHLPFRAGLTLRVWLLRSCWATFPDLRTVASEPLEALAKLG